MSWVDDAKSTSMHAIVARLGLRISKRRATPCPSCGNASDSAGRGALRIGADFVHCNASGGCKGAYDRIDLVAVATEGGKYGELTDAAKARVRRWFEGDGVAVELEIREPPEPERPPPDVLAAVMRRCRQVDRSRRDEVRRWLESRGFAGRRVPAWELPPPGQLRGSLVPESWAWNYPLVVPAYTPAGALGSLHGRRVGDGEGPKTLWLAGVPSRGLVFADPWLALPWMRGASPPVAGLIFVEGLPDYLDAASLLPAEGWAVIGIENGSASGLRAARLPDVEAASVAVHDDVAGDGYAKGIEDALGEAHGMPIRRLLLRDLRDRALHR